MLKHSYCFYLILLLALLLQSCGTASQISDTSAPLIRSVNIAPAVPAIGQQVTFTADYTADAPRTFGWIIGGGSGQQTSSLESPTFVFAVAGRHVGTLTITDGRGRSTSRAFSFNIVE